MSLDLLIRERFQPVAAEEFDLQASLGETGTKGFGVEEPTMSVVPIQIIELALTLQ